MIGKTNCGSGGGGSLGVKVKAYTSAEALRKDKPLDGTYGYVTSDPRAGWTMGFKYSEASEAVEGHAYILLGTASPIGTVVGRKNKLTICPIEARVATNGAWSSTLLLLRNNGEWIEPSLVLVSDEGAWMNDLLILSGDVKLDSDGLSLRTIGGKGTACYAYINLDISPYSLLKITAYSGITAATSAVACAVGITDNVGNSASWVKSVDMKPTATGVNTYEVDISATNRVTNVQALVRGNTTVSSARRCSIKEWSLIP